MAVRHPDIKRLARRPVLRAVLSDDARAVRVEVLAKEDAPKFWTIRDGNHNSFPLLPIGAGPTPIPLRRGGGAADRQLLADGKKPIADRAGALRRLIATSESHVEPLAPWPTYRSRLSERRHQLASLAGGPAEALLKLLDYLLNDPNGLKVLSKIEAATRALAKTPLDEPTLELVREVLFVGGGEILLDLEGTKARADDPSNVPAVSEALRGGHAPMAHSSSQRLCALTGSVEFVEDDKFPQAALPVLGPTYLFAKNADLPCAKRYRRSGPDGFPVSRALASQLAAAAEALTTPDREGKTWARLVPERGTQPDLLLSYVPAAPDLGLAQAITTDPAVLESLSSDIQALAKGRAVPVSEHAELVVLRKVDPGNRKVVSRTTASLDHLRRAADSWTAGCRNVPDAIGLHVPQGKGKPADLRGPRLIVPAAIVALGKQVYIRGGTQRQEAPGPTFGDAMSLFLGAGERRQSIARNLLSVFLSRRGLLLAGIAHAARLRDSKRFDSAAALDTVSALGLLLSVLGRPKEAYMNDAAFRLGQLLAAADVLHLGYCHDVRGGSIPSSLIGNQLLATARSSPLRALDQLTTRWKFYQGWATKRRATAVKPQQQGWTPARAVWSAVWVPLNLRECADKLRTTLPENLDDRGRAELLLGYMAGPPGKPLTDMSPRGPAADDDMDQ
ncbi:MAG: hypothetical protein ACKVW3_13890 [Phycisphaerales bacterium]